jgi:hypothetical protein
MRSAKWFFSWILCFTLFLPALVSFAGDEYILRDGTRAVIEGKKLILIGQYARRTVAPPGRYDTRGGRYSIVVKGEEIVIRDHAKELR